MRLPEGEVVFLMTDIVGSSALAERDQDLYIASIFRHDQEVEEAVVKNNGTLLKHRGEGDSTFSVFATSDDAVRAAIEIHSRLRRHNTLIRTGIHLGKAQLVSRDYLGDPVNRCARIRGMAKPDQILVSSAVRQKCCEDFRFVSFGLQSIRGLTTGVEVFEVLNTGSPSEAAMEQLPTNPPPRVFNRFINRKAEIEQVLQLVRDYRLVTIHGEGGIGKTRLAIEVTGQCKQLFEGGIEYIDLSATTSSTCLSLLYPLRERPSVMRKLVVLDGCQHVMERVGAWLEDALRSSQNITFLVTSQIALQIESEYIVRLLPLSTSGAKSDAVELLFARAQEKGASKAQLAAQQNDIEKLAVKLDGIPLALEIVASRLRSVSARRILDSLDKQVEGSRGVDSGDRWTNFTELCRYTIGLLSPPLLKFAQGCSILGQSFSFDAAGSLPEDFAANEFETAEYLESLVTHSILTVNWERDSLQYRMTNAFRVELSSGLEEGVRASLRSRLRDWALATCSTILESPTAATHVRPFLPDLTTAIEQSILLGDGDTARRLLLATRKSWFADEQPHPGVALVEQTLPLLEPGTEEHADLLNSLGILLNFANRRKEALEAYEQAITGYERLGIFARVSVAKHNRALVLYQQGQFEVACEELHQVMETSLSRGHHPLVTSCLVHLAAVEFELGRVESAEQYAERAKHTGAAFTASHASMIELGRGEQALAAGNLDLADRSFMAVISYEVFMQNYATITRIALNLSLLLREYGRVDEGARLASLANRFARCVGVHFSPRDILLVNQVKAAFLDRDDSGTGIATYADIRDEIMQFTLAFSQVPN